MVSSHVNDQATFSQVRIKLTGKVIHGMRFRSFLDHVFEIDVTDGVVRVVANLRFSSVQSVRFLKRGARPDVERNDDDSVEHD